MSPGEQPCWTTEEAEDPLTKPTSRNAADALFGMTTDEPADAAVDAERPDPLTLDELLDGVESDREERLDDAFELPSSAKTSSSLPTRQDLAGGFRRMVLKVCGAEGETETGAGESVVHLRSPQMISIWEAFALPLVSARVQTPASPSGPTNTHRFTDRVGARWLVEWKPADASRTGGRSGLSFFAGQAVSFFVPMSKINPAEFTDEELQAMVDHRGVGGWFGVRERSGPTPQYR